MSQVYGDILLCFTFYTNEKFHTLKLKYLSFFNLFFIINPFFSFKPLRYGAFLAVLYDVACFVTLNFYIQQHSRMERRVTNIHINILMNVYMSRAIQTKRNMFGVGAIALQD